MKDVTEDGGTAMVHAMVGVSFGVDGFGLVVQSRKQTHGVNRVI